ncbi:hypothetical protein GCM10027300_39420 [Modestobacter lapidis]|nr:transposase [Modestobacter lapidis]
MGAELADAYAIEAAWEAWVDHRRVYGARRLTAEVRDRGHVWNRKRAARLMRVGGIEAIHRRRRGKYGRRAGSTATAPDRVQRNFTAAAPNQLWVADITYLRSWEGSWQPEPTHAAGAVFASHNKALTSTSNFRMLPGPEGGHGGWAVLHDHVARFTPVRPAVSAQTSDAASAVRGPGRGGPRSHRRGAPAHPVVGGGVCRGPAGRAIVDRGAGPAAGRATGRP